MEKTIQDSEKKVKYLNILGRVMLAILAAFSIIKVNEPKPIWELLGDPNFRLSFSDLTFTAYFYFTLIFVITRYLDSKLPWISKRMKRSLAQFLFCFIFPLYLVSSLATLHYDYKGLDIGKSNFYYAEWIIIISITIIINMFYINHYMTRFINLIRKVYNERNKPHLLKKWRVKKGANTIQLCESEVKLFHCINKLNYGVISDLLRYDINESLDNIYNRLDPKQFFRNSRQVIISRKVIEGYKIGPSNTLILKLNFEYDYEITVSQKKVKKFIEWYDGKK